MLILLLNFNPYPFKHEDISDFIRSAQLRSGRKSWEGCAASAGPSLACLYDSSSSREGRCIFSPNIYVADLSLWK